MSTIHIVVGENFQGFARHEGVVTLKLMMAKLADAAAWRGDERVVIGQGIHGEALRALLAALDARGIRDVRRSGELADAKLTHKQLSSFNLVTTPKRSAPGKYRFQFSCGDELDRLSDHVTGQHISAMLLLEAARQAIIVAVELEYPAPAGSKLGLVVDEYNSKFVSYAFPVPTKVDVELQEMGRTDNQISLLASARFSQSGQEVCLMQMSGGIYDQRLLTVLETKRARRAARAAVSHCMDTGGGDRLSFV